MKNLNSLMFFAIALSVSNYSHAEGTKLESARKGHKEYSPYLKDNYPDKVFLVTLTFTQHTRQMLVCLVQH